MTNDPFEALIAKVSEADLVALGKDESRLHIVAQADRCGVDLFMVRIEHQLFPPRSGRNHLFEYCILRFPAPDGLMWFVFSVPNDLEIKNKIEIIAEECGLVLRDGIPILLGGTEQQDLVFPVNGRTTFTVENTPGHPIYKGGEELRLVREKNQQQCEEILENDSKKMVQELIAEGFSLAQVERIIGQWRVGNDNYMEKPENGSQN